MKTAIIAITLSVCCAPVFAQLHTFYNGSLTLFVDYDMLAQEADEVEFSVYKDCEVKGLLTLRRINRQGTDYEGANFYEWNEGDCYISIDAPYGEPSTLNVEISGDCPCMAEADRAPAFQYGNWLEAPEGAEVMTAISNQEIVDMVNQNKDRLDCYMDDSGAKCYYLDMAMGTAIGLLEGHSDDGPVYFFIDYNPDTDVHTVHAVKKNGASLNSTTLNVVSMGDYLMVDDFPYEPCE